MNQRKTKTIIVDREAYFFLDRKQRQERGGRPLTTEAEDRFWERFVQKDKNNLVELTDLSFGGGDGTHDGKWWPWNVDTLKKMLSEAGLSFKEGPDTEYILV